MSYINHRATKSSLKMGDEDDQIPPPVKVQEVKLARTLASDITQSGAKLFDLLASEVTDR